MSPPDWQYHTVLLGMRRAMELMLTGDPITASKRRRSASPTARFLGRARRVGARGRGTGRRRAERPRADQQAQCPPRLRRLGGAGCHPRRHRAPGACGAHSHRRRASRRVARSHEGREPVGPNAAHIACSGKNVPTEPRGAGGEPRRSQVSMFSYEGKRVVVSGGGGAGMGAAAVEGLAEMGAEIHVLDLREPPIKVASYQSADLRDPTPSPPRSSRSGAASTRCSTVPACPERRSPISTRCSSIRRRPSPRRAGRAAHDQRRCNRKHLVDCRRTRTATTSRSGSPSWRRPTSRRRRRGSSAPRGDRRRLHTVEGGAHHLDDGRRARIAAEHPVELHQPRTDRHADDAGIREHGGAEVIDLSRRASGVARRRPSRRGR